MTYEIPNTTKAVQHLSFLVSPGSNLLVMGPSGAGKSCLVRILSGIWRAKEGVVLCPPHVAPFPDPDLSEDASRLQQQGIHFIPQNPYFPTGSLAYQLTYPLLPSQTAISMEAICELLVMVDLLHLASRPELWEEDLGEAQPLEAKPAGGYNLVHWTDLLSPGERQRLAFARIFFHRPVFAVLDEATSALHPESQDKMYRTLQRLNITVVSVGHHQSLRNYHHNLLIIDQYGQWTIEPI